jgi:hypothetical protein
MSTSLGILCFLSENDSNILRTVTQVDLAKGAMTGINVMYNETALGEVMMYEAN